MNWTEAIRRLNVSEWLFWNCPLSLLVHWAMIKSPMIDNYRKCVMRAFVLIQPPHYWRSYAIDTYTEQVIRQNCHREKKIDLATTRIISFCSPPKKCSFTLEISELFDTSFLLPLPYLLGQRDFGIQKVSFWSCVDWSFTFSWTTIYTDFVFKLS